MSVSSSSTLTTTTSSEVSGLHSASTVHAEPDQSAGQNVMTLVEKPHDILQAEQEVLRDPYDVDAWKQLLRFAQQQPVEAAREVYEMFLDTYPNAAEYWQVYAEHELKEGNTEEVEAILGRCLLTVPDIELWRFYVDFIVDTKLTPVLNDVNRQESGQTSDEPATEDVLAARVIVARAYEYALEKMGLVHGSEYLWRQYITFLKEEKPASQYAISQKRDSLRSAYQKAICAPLSDIDEIWNEYCAFEREQSQPELANKLISQYQSNYGLSRKVSLQRRTRWGTIQRRMISRPPIPDLNAVSPQRAEAHREMISQMRAWRHLLSFEVGNPLQLSSDQHSSLMRTQFEQALLVTRWFPDVWHDWALFEISRENISEASAVYDRALDSVSSCMTLCFVAADFFELHDNRERTREIYEKLVDAEPSALAFIQYQRYARRCEGIKQARIVFGRARKSSASCPAIFLAAAQLEFYANRSPEAARNILELGRKTFPADPDYAAAYIDFMISTGEDSNLRALFENMLEAVPVESARPIWDRYIDYEMRRAQGGGSLEKVAKVEARRAELYPHDDAEFASPFLRSMHRYQHWGLLPNGNADKDILQRYAYRPRLFHTETGSFYNVIQPEPPIIRKVGKTDGAQHQFSTRRDSSSNNNQRDSKSSTSRSRSRERSHTRSSTEHGDRDNMQSKPNTIKYVPETAPAFLIKLIAALPPWERGTQVNEAEIESTMHAIARGRLPPRPQNREPEQSRKRPVETNDSQPSETAKVRRTSPARAGAGDIYRDRQRQQLVSSGALQLQR